jgi:hypothetical protein
MNAKLYGKKAVPMGKARTANLRRLEWVKYFELACRSPIEAVRYAGKRKKPFA